MTFPSLVDLSREVRKRLPKEPAEVHDAIAILAQAEMEQVIESSSVPGTDPVFLAMRFLFRIQE